MVRNVFVFLLAMIVLATSFDSFASAIVDNNTDVSTATAAGNAPAFMSLEQQDGCPLHELSNCTNTSHCHNSHSHVFTFQTFTTPNAETQIGFFDYSRKQIPGVATLVERPPIA